MRLRLKQIRGTVDADRRGRILDEALRNAEEALALYVEASEGRAIPLPRTLSALRNDPAVAPDLHDHMVALVALKVPAAHAAE